MQATSFHKGMRVNREDVYEARDRCPVCLSQNERHACLRIQDDPVIEMLFCKTCEACSASHMPKRELLDRYYAQYYSKAGDHVAFSSPERFARMLDAETAQDQRPALRLARSHGKLCHPEVHRQRRAFGKLAEPSCQAALRCAPWTQV